MQKVITVKSVQEKSKGGNKWIELTDMEEKVHRVFSSIQLESGEGRHLDKQFPMLQESEGKALKLTKEKKGDFWNVIDVELVKNVLTQEAQKEVEDKYQVDKLRSQSLSYAKDLICAFISIGKMKEVDADTPIKLADQTIKVANKFNNWLTDKIAEKINEEIDSS